MRKSTNIILSAILSLMIVWIGSGIMTVVCEHTGLVSVAHQTSKRHCNDADANHCMKLQMKTLSPTDTAPTGFHHLQPVLLSLLPQLITNYELLPLPVHARATWRMSHPPLHGSSRQYLRLLTSLLIWFCCSPHCLTDRQWKANCALYARTTKGTIAPNYQLFWCQVLA